MMIIVGDNNMNEMKGAHHMPHARIDPLRPIPPHERESFMSIEFDQNDWKILKEVFGDEDTANAAAEIIRAAPPEIQILAAQLIDIIEEV